MTKFKLSILTVFSLFVVSSIFISCSNDDSELSTINEVSNFNNEINQSATNRTTTKITPKDLEYIGINHNRLLEESFNYINANNLPNLSDGRSEFKTFIYSRVDKEIVNHNEAKELAITSLNLLLEKPKFKLNDYYDTPTGKLLSVNLKFHINKLFQILSTNDSFNENVILEEIINLESNISRDNKLNNYELSVIFSATQTAKYSTIYWKENLPKWSNTFGKLPPPGDIALDIVMADAGGALVGAATAWISNVVPFFGQIAYGSAIFLGGFGASAMSGWNHFTNWLTD